MKSMPFMTCRFVRLSMISLLPLLAGSSCARLPYVTAVIHESPRALVVLQQEVSPAAYAHPVELTSQQVAALLRGFTIREQHSLPLRWYAEEAPPTSVFREDEIRLVAPLLSEALRRAGPQERAAFSLYGPGMNPKYDRDVTAGWIAVRERYLHLTMEYVHSVQPATRFSPYDVNYPTPPAQPKPYVLYFEPGRFWELDETAGTRGVDFRAFLKSAEARP